jgi:hypothetical protein
LYRRICIPFRLEKFAISLPFHPEWEIPLSQAEAEQISFILSQKFTFLGKGNQSFAFVSEDEKYVLKIPRRPFRLTRAPRKLPEDLCTSCKLSYDHLRKETGLVYVHLNPSSKWPLIHVTDALGFSHSIDPSRFRFFLQRKATPFLSGQKDPSFAELMDTFREKGIAPMDLKIRSNFGLLDGTTIQIDFIDNVYDPVLSACNTEKLKQKS